MTAEGRPFFFITMKTLFPYLYIIITVLFACSKLELPAESEKEGGAGTPVQPTDPSVPSAKGDTLTVAEALGKEEYDFGLVKGYMVGYVQGTSLQSGAKFELSQSENSNFLMADRPDEVDVDQCIAVKLEKTGKFACRTALNMKDHPEFFKKCFLVEGEFSMYFKKTGVTRIFTCEILENNDENFDDGGNSSDNGGNEEENGEQDVENEGNGGENAPSTSDSIGIVHGGEKVPDGRNFKKILHFSCKTFGTLK